MADSFEFVTAYPISVQVGPTELRDYERVLLRALPSGVVFSVDVRQGADLAEVTRVAGGELAPVFNAWWATPGVTALTISEDINAADTIAEVVTVTVDSSSGDSTAERRRPRAGTSTPVFQEWVAGIRAELDALEAV